MHPVGITSVLRRYYGGAAFGFQKLTDLQGFMKDRLIFGPPRRKSHRFREYFRIIS